MILKTGTMSMSEMPTNWKYNFDYFVDPHNCNSTLLSFSLCLIPHMVKFNKLAIQEMKTIGWIT